MKKSLLAFAVLGALSTFAFADAAVSLNAGTTGVGVHLTNAYSDNLNFRFGLNGFSHSVIETTGGATYDVDANLRTFDALVDYHPGGSGFRLTGGLIYNGNELDATATPTGSGIYTFNGQTYTAASAGNVTGTMDFNKIAPYFGIGFGNAVAKNKGWGFVADLGVMFQGSPKVTLTSNNCTADQAICDQLAADLEAEATELRDDAKDYRFYPVVRIGVSYKF
jgi:hypothetical protein